MDYYMDYHGLYIVDYYGLFIMDYYGFIYTHKGLKSKRHHK